MTNIPNKNQPVKPEREDTWFDWIKALRDSRLFATIPPKHAVVIFMLYAHRGTNGWCWPSQETLANECGVSTKTVKRAIQTAKICMGVQVKKGGGRKPKSGSEKKRINYRTNSYYLPLNETISSWQPSRKKKRKKHT